MKGGKSLQQIEDYYVNLGYKQASLQKILKKDKNYQRILKNRKRKLSHKVKINYQEKKKYVLSTTKDFEILDKCKKLDKINLTTQEKSIIKLIKTQLKTDWRTPLIKYLNKLLKKFK